MNERIKELAEQAWDATAVSPQFGHPVSFAEKFSELIVKECAEVLDETISPPSHPMNSIGYRLKEHFGIKE
jgi:hypothetical protein